MLVLKTDNLNKSLLGTVQGAELSVQGVFTSPFGFTSFFTKNFYKFLQGVSPTGHSNVLRRHAKDCTANPYRLQS